MAFQKGVFDQFLTMAMLQLELEQTTDGDLRACKAMGGRNMGIAYQNPRLSQSNYRWMDRFVCFQALNPSTREAEGAFGLTETNGAGLTPSLSHIHSELFL